jgi:hypothetical protein
MKMLKIALMTAAMAVTPAVAAQSTTAADAATSAQPAGSDIAVGATVLGNDGNPVGTIESVSGEVVVINTGKHKAPVPATAIGSGETGPSVNITQAQLNEMMDAQLAEATTRRDSALVAGAEVVSANGNPAGTLAEVDLAADTIVLDSPAGKVALKKEHFAVDSEGRLMALFTREQIETAAAAGTGGTGATN